MKLIVLQIALILFCTSVFAQNVGIGTITPQARLHVAMHYGKGYKLPVMLKRK